MKHNGTIIWVIVILIVFVIIGFGIGFSRGKAQKEIEVSTPIAKSEPIENTDIGDVPEPQAEKTEYYPLSEQEYTELCKVVMSESGGECYEGQMAVAQCILNACLRDNIRPLEAVVKYQYTGKRKTATESVKSAVTAVFTNGEKITNEEILFFYAPKYCTSEWHESQRFIVEIGGHRFFALK